MNTSSENQLSIDLVPQDSEPALWAKAMVRANHYLHSVPDPRARVMTYVLRLRDAFVGTVMLGIPHATRCGGWWGYPGLPTQWQVIDLCRIWLHPDVQTFGCWCKRGIVPGFVDRRGDWRPATATWAIREVLARVQRDRVALWPPVYPEQPYHILLGLSYHDPKFHRGTIYKASGAEPMYTSRGQPVAGSSGKLGWCWRLPEPNWTWQDLTDINPRTMRMF